MPRWICPVLIALALPSVRADAQEESGPKVGTRVPGFKVHAATGAEAGKIVDFVAGRKVKPTVYVFVRAADWDRPMSRFLKKLDEEYAQGIAGADDPMTVAVWLTDDKEKSKEYLPHAQESLQLAHTDFAVFDGGPQGPEGWELNTGMRLSAVVVRDGKVTGSFGYLSINETDVPAVLKAIAPR